MRFNGSLLRQLRLGLMLKRNVFRYKLKNRIKENDLVAYEDGWRTPNPFEIKQFADFFGVIPDVFNLDNDSYLPNSTIKSYTLKTFLPEDRPFCLAYAGLGCGLLKALMDSLEFTHSKGFDTYLNFVNKYKEKSVGAIDLGSYVRQSLNINSNSEISLFFTQLSIYYLQTKQMFFKQMPSASGFTTDGQPFVIGSSNYVALDEELKSLSGHIGHLIADPYKEYDIQQISPQNATNIDIYSIDTSNRFGLGFLMPATKEFKANVAKMKLSNPKYYTDMAKKYSVTVSDLEDRLYWDGMSTYGKHNAFKKKYKQNAALYEPFYHQLVKPIQFNMLKEVISFLFSENALNILDLEDQYGITPRYLQLYFNIPEENLTKMEEKAYSPVVNKTKRVKARNIINLFQNI